MAKVTLAPEFESISGKLCSKAASTIAVNKRTGKMYRYDSHPGKQPNSTKQQTVKTTFSARAKAAATWWNANKPIVSTDGTVTRQATADYQKMMKAYNAQRKYGNPFLFLRSLVQEDLTITIGGTTSATPTNPNDPNRVEEEL